MKELSNKILLLGVLVASLVSCGDESPRRPELAGQENATMLKEKMQLPPRYYDAAMAHIFDLVFDRQGKLPLTDKTVVFLNLSGGEIKKGSRIGESFIPCADKVTVPPLKRSESEIAQIVTAVRDYTRLILPTVEIVTSRPENGQFSEVLVGGHADILGCGIADIKYVAPSDVFNFNPADVAFVFGDAAVDLNGLITAIEDSIETIMGYDVDAVPPSNLRELPGIDALGAMHTLVLQLKDGDVTKVNFLNSELNELLPSKGKHVDDVAKIIMVSASISQDLDAGNGGGNGGDGGGSGGSGTGLFSWLIRVITGGLVSSDGRRNVTDVDVKDAINILRSNPEFLAASKGLAAVMTGSMSGVDESQINKRLLPDYSDLLEVGEITDLWQLAVMLEAHVAFAETRYSGKTFSALKSMLALAYAQLYRTISVSVPAN